MAGNNMTRKVFLLILVIVSLALVSTALAGEDAAAEETYIVLYRSKRRA